MHDNMYRENIKKLKDKSELKDLLDQDAYSNFGFLDKRSSCHDSKSGRS